jgi:adenosylhomocysteine nucleosidase
MSRVAIIAALPGELKPLVKGWAHRKEDGADLWQWKFDQGAWIAACGGMGADAATRAFAAIERQGQIDLVISYGWVGALTAKAKPGTLSGASGVIDTRTGERFRVAAWTEDSWLVTAPQVADGVEKRRLAERYKAELAAMRDLPFYLCRGVSDGVDDVLPDFNRFRGVRGEFQMAKFVAYAATHPRYWPALVRMGENSKKAANQMASAVLGFLDERGYIRKRNGYPGTDPS